MTSESELRRRLDEIKEELDLAKERASEAEVQELIGRAKAIVEELRSTLPVEVKKHDIMEWEGLGAELWRKLDVDDFVRKERESWH
jgi:hypothetical protein